MTTADHLSLAEGQSHGLTDWEDLAAAVLRKSGRLAEGDPSSQVWDKLTRTTLDGIGVTPLGTPELVADLPAPVRPSATGDGWDVRSLVLDPDAAASRQAALTDLENGVTSLWLQLGDSGVPVADLAVVLKDVLLDVAPVVLDCPEDPLGAARAFAGVAGETRVLPETNLGADPVAAVVRRALAGLDPVAIDADQVVADVAAVAAELGCRALVVDGTAVHDHGASDGQELGYLIAVGAGYLRALVASGLDVDTAAGMLEFRLAATDEQFPTIAKFRAARRLWARVLELSGAAVTPMRLHAVTSRPMMSKYDPWVNMLRTCVAAFGAGVGGADAVTVLPFDAPLGLPDGFSRRIARNTSALLIHESHLGKVADPAGGSFAVEKLTDDLAQSGWTELGALEQSGGVLAALADGSLATRVDAVVAERDRQVARRKKPLTGLTEFPNLEEVLPERAAYPEAALPVRPYGHAFEALRDAPVAERVFLATQGTVAAHTARATFAANLFAAGGIATVNAGRHDDADAVLASYAEAGNPAVVCLVGNDKAYAAWGAELVERLRAAGARWVILAGKPVDGVTVDDSCAMGLDALDFLTRTRAQLSPKENA